MATPGRVLDEGTRNRIFRLLREGWSYRAIARAARVSKTTVVKYSVRLRVREQVLGTVSNWYEKRIRFGHDHEQN